MSDIQRVDFFVIGDPVPQGSMKYVGGNRIVASNKKLLQPWRANIAASIVDQLRDQAPTTGPIFPEGLPLIVRASFTVKAPGTVRKTQPNYPAKKPDLDKLLRALCDGISDAKRAGVNVLWNDDNQVVRFRDVTKTYPADVLGADPSALNQPGVRVSVSVAGGLRG